MEHITIEQLKQVLADTTIEARLRFWQKPSDFQRGLIENFKKIGVDVSN